MNPSLQQVQETGLRVQRLDKLRRRLIIIRDNAAWSLLKYGDETGEWSNPRIRAIFGASSHNAWLKSRQRLTARYPDGNPPRINDAREALKTTARRINTITTAQEQAVNARTEAYKAALDADPNTTLADLARAAGRTRQAVWAELGKKAA